ncbi:hypothetical protein [Parafrankia sp. EUN1f]|uniref:hypothetical protein n=1 Tax=Parafrankia sp. EUN1f TaxID=102897 RepID=UPI0001C470EC|nr:hypothetical protein [Parafrankia sp. EUN1f]EFC80010.1 hypothetical protein FrEUN1fDRAFT_6871 [Parafrankia sp. EUN1f]
MTARRQVLLLELSATSPDRAGAPTSARSVHCTAPPLVSGSGRDLVEEAEHLGDATVGAGAGLWP